MISNDDKERIKAYFEGNEDYKKGLRSLRGGSAETRFEGVRFRKGMRLLEEEDGIIRWKGRVYIPKEMRQAQLEGAHNGHKKKRDFISDMIKRRVWWPRWNIDVENFATNCEECLMNQPSKTSAPPSAM